VIIDLMQTEAVEMRSQAHANCVICSPSNERGLGLEFTLSQDGGVKAAFGCDKTFQGYDNVLHGGVVASLLDGAMTNCMFVHGCIGVTAELNVRFRHPVVTGRTATVHAWITRSASPLYLVKAEVLQDSQLKATATGKFLDQGDWAAGR